MEGHSPELVVDVVAQCLHPLHLEADLRHRGVGLLHLEAQPLPIFLNRCLYPISPVEAVGMLFLCCIRPSLRRTAGLDCFGQVLEDGDITQRRNHLCG